jgi:hypothetical protein
MRSVILAVALAVAALPSARSAPASEASPATGGLINLSCMEALAAIEQPALAGVFSFVPEKDSPAAFADLVAHDSKAMKKYVAKLDKDYRAAAGITTWDHDAVMFAISLFSGPADPALAKPAAKVLSHLTELSLAPRLTLEAVTAKRGR